MVNKYAHAFAHHLGEYEVAVNVGLAQPLWTAQEHGRGAGEGLLVATSLRLFHVSSDDLLLYSEELTNIESIARRRTMFPQLVTLTIQCDGGPGSQRQFYVGPAYATDLIRFFEGHRSHRR